MSLRGARAGALEAEAGGEGGGVTLFTSLLAPRGFYLLSYSPRRCSPEVARRTVTWVLPHKSAIKNAPQDLPIGQADGGIFSVEISSSQMSPTCATLTKKIKEKAN